MREETKVVIGVSIACVFLIMSILAWMIGGPMYNVWSMEMQGKAKLAEATSSRQIQIEEAKSKFEAAKSLAQAEIERARGVAEANKIIGDSLRDNEAYLRYLWVIGLQDNDKDGKSDQKTVVYVDMKGNFPVMESGRAVDKPEQSAAK